MLLASLTNIPKVHVVDRIVVPGARFIRTNESVRMKLVYSDNSAETITVDSDFISRKVIKRIILPPDIRSKTFKIDVYDNIPSILDDDPPITFPPSDPRVFPQRLVTPSLVGQQLITNGASYSASGIGQLILHIIGGGGGGGAGGGYNGSTGGGGGGAGGNGAVAFIVYAQTNYSLSCSAGTGGSGGSSGGNGSAGTSSSCTLTDNVLGTQLTITSGGGGGGSGADTSPNGGAGGNGGSVSLSTTSPLINIVSYMFINGATGGAGAGGSSSAGGNGGSTAAQSPYFTFSTSTNSFTSSLSSLSGGAGSSSGVGSNGSNGAYYGQAGSGGGGNVTYSSPTSSGGAGAPGAVFIGILQEYG